jgi:RNA polymerase sigma factor (sigma-70 family)
MEPAGSNGEKELIINYIRQFNDAEKLIIMLHLDGYSNDEIALIAGISKNHVAVKLHRLKEKLAENIKDNTNGN